MIAVCVETPIDPTTHDPSYKALKTALVGVAPILKRGALVSIESTLAPGTMEGLVRPTIEVARVLDAVADGDLSQKMSLTIEGRPVRGEFRRIGTRFEKLAVNFHGMLQLAMIRRCLKMLFSDRA